MLGSQRLLYGYSIHGRDSNGVIDYSELFRRLANLESTSRLLSLRDDFIVSFKEMTLVDSVWEVRMLFGDRTESITLWDVDADRERDDAKAKGEIVARSTHLYLDPVSRFAGIERRRPGLSPGDIGLALSRIGPQIGFGRDLVIDFTPVAAESFTDELLAFTRIRQASVSLTRPNFDWSDNANQLTGYAGQSNGQYVEIEVSAKRGESLSPETGIVADIKNLAQNPISPLRGVRVRGTYASEPGERSLSLNSHQERESFSVGGDGEVPTWVRMRAAGLSLIRRLRNSNASE